MFLSPSMLQTGRKGNLFFVLARFIVRRADVGIGPYNVLLLKCRTTDGLPSGRFSIMPPTAAYLTFSLFSFLSSLT